MKKKRLIDKLDKLVDKIMMVSGRLLQIEPKPISIIEVQRREAIKDALYQYKLLFEENEDT